MYCRFPDPGLRPDHNNWFSPPGKSGNEFPNQESSDRKHNNDNEPAEKYKALFTAVVTIKEIDLSKDQDYGNRRDWLVSKFESIIEQLKKDCKIELSDFLPAAPPPPTKKSQEALDYFYSGYYLLGEGYGIRGISNTLAAKAFGYFAKLSAKEFPF